VLGAPLHRHSREDELSCILEGELTAQLGDRIVIAPAGTYIPKPRGEFHTFWNAGAIAVRFIEIISPAGFEYYFAELGKIFAAQYSPEMEQEKLAALRERFGLEMDMSSIPRLMEAHKVSLR
jgi:uncharacterized cupin superfamily protein